MKRQAQGCALRIRLSSRSRQVFSVNTIYNSPSEARKACAETALAEGVIDYIKSWSASSFDLGEDTEASGPLPLQQFFETLPHPFPEPITSKSAVDVNSPAWLNTALQAARGGKLVPNFVWTADTRSGCERHALVV